MVHAGRLLGSGCAILVAVLAAAGAAAQPAGQHSPQAASLAPGVPPALIDAMLAGGRYGVAALGDYFGPGTLSPQETTRRAVALIRALGDQAGRMRGEELVRALDRITGFAARMLATTSVLRFAIDEGYRPAADAIALDFGPAEAPTMEGFDKVAPGDARIAGKELAGLRRPLDQPLIASGIAGVEKIAVQVPPGDYRIVLMTQNLGDPRIMENPFGRSLRINGVPLLVGRSAPQQWLDAALLSTRDIASTNGQTVAGLLSGEFDIAAGRRVAEQQAGALVIEARAPDGRVIIEMADFGQARTYIAGLLIEPANRVSNLILRAGVGAALLPLDMRLALEAEILAAAASLLEQIATAAGGEPPIPIRPEFEAAEVVSGN